MSNDAPISDRELEILRLVATGASNQQIAQQLSISTNTVKVHLRNIFGKIGVVSRTEATLYAIRYGLVAVASGVAAVPEADAVMAPVVAPAELADVLPEASATIPDADQPSAPFVRPVPSRRSAPLLLMGAALSIGLVLIVVLGGQLIAQRPTPTAESATAVVPAASDPNQRWFTHTSLPAPRDGFALTAYDLERKLYVIGGRVAGTVSAAVDRYDPVSDRWIVLTDKPTAVSDASAIVLHGSIYMPGGEDSSGKVRNILEIYNPRDQRWETGAVMPAPRSRYALVVWEGRLYLLGGWDGTTIRSEVFIYDPQTKAWAEGPPLPSPRQGAGAITASGRIYMIGGDAGSGPLRESIRLDPTEADARWEVIAPLPDPVMLPGVVAPVGTILAFDPGRHLGFRYDQAADTWEKFAIPDDATVASHVALLGPSIYLINDAAAPAPGAMSEYQAVFTVFLPGR
jgi:DNA-binding CsgD family transcriptional regulator